MRAPRRLTVMVSLDVAGYTRLVQEDERGTLSELRAIRFELAEPTIAARGGKIIKTMGDGALVEFPNVEDAVEWTIGFQTTMAARNAGRAKPIVVRAAVALADVFVQGTDRFGAAVGFVVRLQEVAPPGGIAITHSVKWQLVGRLAALFHPEPRDVKDFGDAMDVWIWTPASQAQPQGTAPVLIETCADPATWRPSIVVLPFDNLSGDPNANYLADGIVEEITATLSRIRDFTVIGRHSAYASRARSATIRDIARELGVRYVLEGSLRKSEARLRVSAQLIDAASGMHLWADRFDGLVGDIFDLQDQIAEQVAGALHPSIREAEIERARHKRPDNLVAYDLVMRALPHLWAHRSADNAVAIELLARALTLDPHYERASALAAWARAQQVVYSWSEDVDADRTEGLRLIGQASAAINDDATALTALATAIMLLAADLDRAQLFIDKALTLDCNHAWAWTRRGFLHVYRGEPELGVTCFERSLRLSPLDPFGFNSFIGLGLAAFAAGRPGEAVRWTQRALAEKPGITWAFRDLATFRAHAGDLDGARDAMAKLIATRPFLTLTHVAEALRFMEPGLLARYLDGLRQAGMPG
jgi:adenylate cyclase